MANGTSDRRLALATKWKKLKTSLRQFTLESSYQDKIDVLKERFRKFDPTKQLAEMFKVAKKDKERIKIELENVNADIEAISQLLLEHMQENNLEAIELATGGRISEVVTPYPQVKDEALFLKWLKKEQPDEHKRLKYPWPSLDRMVRERLDEGETMPPGVDAFYKNTVRLYGGNSGEED